jgi:hypothetical protein
VAAQEAAMETASRERLSKGEFEHELEQGLADTLPASDPPTSIQPVHREQPKKR